MSDHAKPGTPILAGWLWADLLLGLFVIFLAASAAPPRQAAAVSISATQSPRSSPTPEPSPTAKASPTPSRAVSPRSIEVSVTVDVGKFEDQSVGVSTSPAREAAIAAGPAAETLLIGLLKEGSGGSGVSSSALYTPAAAASGAY